MDQLIWSETAIKDLKSIAEYIAPDSEYAATKIYSGINKQSKYIIASSCERPSYPGRYSRKLQANTSQKLSYYL